MILQMEPFEEFPLLQNSLAFFISIDTSACLAPALFPFRGDALPEQGGPEWAVPWKAGLWPVRPLPSGSPGVWPVWSAESSAPGRSSRVVFSFPRRDVLLVVSSVSVQCLAQGTYQHMCEALIASTYRLRIQIIICRCKDFKLNFSLPNN